MSHHDTESAPAWRAQAECGRPEYKNKDLWFPTASDATSIRDAKRVCWSCPVMRECLAWSFANREDRGVWGGMTEKERRKIHKRPAPKHHTSDAGSAPRERKEKPVPKKREPAKCGTRPGYRRHRANGEAACDACRQANTDADNRLRRTGTTKAVPKQPATLAEAFAARTLRTDGGHVSWRGDKRIDFQDTKYNALRVAFELGHGRAPEGPVRRTCGKDCYLSGHLTDAIIRDQLAVCGTELGYHRHLKRGETTCQPCRDANAGVAVAA